MILRNHSKNFGVGETNFNNIIFEFDMNNKENSKGIIIINDNNEYKYNDNNLLKVMLHNILKKKSFLNILHLQKRISIKNNNKKNIENKLQKNYKHSITKKNLQNNIKYDIEFKEMHRE